MILGIIGAAQFIVTPAEYVQTSRYSNGALERADADRNGVSSLTGTSFGCLCRTGPIEGTRCVQSFWTTCRRSCWWHSPYTPGCPCGAMARLSQWTCAQTVSLSSHALARCLSFKHFLRSVQSMGCARAGCRAIPHSTAAHTLQPGGAVLRQWRLVAHATCIGGHLSLDRHQPRDPENGGAVSGAARLRDGCWGGAR